jgi:hypothetical protein
MRTLPVKDDNRDTKRPIWNSLARLSVREVRILATYFLGEIYLAACTHVKSLFFASYTCSPVSVYCVWTCSKFFVFLGGRGQPPPPVSQSLVINEVSRSHITTQHIPKDSSGQVISSSQRSLTWQHTTHITNIHASAGIEPALPAS